MNDEFYIGWQDKAPPLTGRRIAIVVAVLALGSVLSALSLGSAQRTILVSTFEWGSIKQFNGVLLATPYPHLRVARPNSQGTDVAFSSYLLVNPLKFGFDPATAARLNGQFVNLTGTLIYRNGQTMIEVVPDSVRAASTESLPGEIERIQLGRQTHRGEIVDSKCYLGVMNPGEFIPHRACAIRCISGGIPPLLIVRRKNAPPQHFVMVSHEGLPLNQDVLDLVGEPVEVTGDVERQGDLLILRADPAAIRRL